MADSSVGISEPAIPTKLLDTETLIVGIASVHRERTQLAGSGAAEITRVKNTAPLTTDYGPVVRTLLYDSAGTGVVATALGQATMANSLPIAIASDQTAIPTSDSATKVDDAAFTPATSRVMVIGAEADETAPDAVDEGDAGALRMTLQRAMHVNLRDSSGVERIDYDLPLTASGAFNAAAQTVQLAVQGRKYVTATVVRGDTAVMRIGYEASSDNGASWEQRIFWNGDAWVAEDPLPNVGAVQRTYSCFVHGADTHVRLIVNSYTSGLVNAVITASSVPNQIMDVMGFAAYDSTIQTFNAAGKFAQVYPLQGSCGFQVYAGTLVGTLVVEACQNNEVDPFMPIEFFDGTTWRTSLPLTNPNAQYIIYVPPAGGYYNVRLRVSAYTSGSCQAQGLATWSNDAFGMAVFAARSGQSVPPLSVNIAGTDGATHRSIAAKITIPSLTDPGLATRNIDTSRSIGPIVLGALNDETIIDLDGMAGAGIIISASSLVGTLNVQASSDGGTLWTSNGVYDASLNFSPNIINPAAPSAFIPLMTGSRKLKVRVSAYTSGSVTIYLIAGRTAGPGFQATMVAAGATLPVFATAVAGVNGSGVSQHLQLRNANPLSTDYGQLTRDITVGAATALEDAASADGDRGMVGLGVRDDKPGPGADTTAVGDYSRFKTDAQGRQWVTSDTIETKLSRISDLLEMMLAESRIQTQILADGLNVNIQGYTNDIGNQSLVS